MSTGTGCLWWRIAGSDGALRRASDAGGGHGHVVDVQADLLSHLATRVVVPLLPEAGAPRPISELNPVCDIDGVRHVLVTQALASIPVRELKRAVSGLSGHRDSVTRALDLLLVGF